MRRPESIAISLRRHSVFDHRCLLAQELIKQLLQLVEGLGQTLSAQQLGDAGGGLRIIAPTGPDNITSGKWQMMPIVGARTMLPELSAGSYFQGVVRYDL